MTNLEKAYLFRKLVSSKYLFIYVEKETSTVCTCVRFGTNIDGEITISVCTHEYSAFKVLRNKNSFFAVRNWLDAYELYRTLRVSADCVRY